MLVSYDVVKMIYNGMEKCLNILVINQSSSLSKFKTNDIFPQICKATRKQESK